MHGYIMYNLFNYCLLCSDIILYYNVNRNIQSVTQNNRYTEVYGTTKFKTLDLWVGFESRMASDVCVTDYKVHYNDATVQVAYNINLLV